MVRPVQHHVVTGAVERFECILAKLAQVKRAQVHVLERRLDISLEVVAAWEMVRVSEDADVRVQGLERMLGVLSNGQ